MIQTLIRRLAPAAALAGAALLGGCDGLNIQIGDKDGVPLAELDMEGAAPTELVLAGPDKVVVTRGDALAIDVSGDPGAVDALRFSLDEETLGIHREKDSWKGKGTATVRVTMPGLNELVLAGSGQIEADRMDEPAEITVAGSGSVKVARLEVERLETTIAGSGDLEISGTADRMDLTIAGSGQARMAGLTVDRAEVSVAGSGDAEFTSDGRVEANIAGSGDITVNGSAECTVSSMGSGSLKCRKAPSAATREAAAPVAPDAPDALEEPEAPEA